MNKFLQLIIIILIISSLASDPYLIEVEHKEGDYRCGITIVDVWRYDPSGEACQAYPGQEIKSCYLVEKQHKNWECEQL